MAGPVRREGFTEYATGLGKAIAAPILHPISFVWFLAPANIKGVRDLGKFLGGIGELAGELLVSFEFPLARLAKGVDALIKALEWCPPIPDIYKKSVEKEVSLENGEAHPGVKVRKKVLENRSWSEICTKEFFTDKKFLSFENLLTHVVAVTKLAAGILSVGIFVMKHVVPVVGRTANSGIDWLIALSASYGSIPLRAASGGLRFVQKLGLDGLRNVLSFIFFSVESYELAKVLQTEAVTTDQKVIKTMDLVTRLVKLAAIMLGTTLIFVPVTWPLVLAITTVGLIAAGCSLLTVVEKHRQEKEKKEKFRLIFETV